MSGQSFRFLHASDLHLEQPLHGVSQVPDHLRDLFLDAPYQAAERVFDTAIHERVDFVVLAGDVLQPQLGGPRALDFLVQQFLRLQEAKIDIYWASGGAGSAAVGWPVAVPLPDNVHRFLGNQSTSIGFTRDGQRLATMYGYAPGSRPEGIDVAALRAEIADGFSIAVAHGSCKVEELRGSGIAYWALGGLHERLTLGNPPEMVQYSGSPQGRASEELGPHGCFLVDVDSGGTPHSQFIATDVVRWFHEKIELDDNTDQPELMRVLRERSSRLSEEAGDRQVFVLWSIVDNDQLSDTRSDKLAAELRQRGLGSQLLKQLRASFGSQVPGVWSVSLEADPPTVLPAGWYEEDTILGDLLRLVQHYQQEPDEPLNLALWLDGQAIDPALEQALRVDDPVERDYLLRRVAVLGVDLLRGDRVLSEEQHANFAWMDMD